MDWLVDRVFPFRRLTVWLGLLVVVVSALALTFSYLLVIASLDDSLVSNRVGPRRSDLSTNLRNELCQCAEWCRG